MGTNGQNYSRKATFVEQTVKGQRTFVPVNKRAKTVVKKLGKRTRVTAAELRTVVGKGSYKFYKYEGATLKAIRV